MKDASLEPIEHQLALPEDAPVLARWNAALIVDEGSRNPMGAAELEERMRNWLDSRVYQAVVFQLRGEFIAYALFRPEPEGAYIRQFYIHPGWRRQGLGRRCLELLTDHYLPAKGRLTVDALCSNPGGLEFWRSVGFQDYCVQMERFAGMQGSVDTSN